MAPTNKEKNTLLKDAVTLFLITLIAGLALGFVYQLTKTPIAQAKEKEKRDAYAKVFTAANDFADKEGKYSEVEAESADLLSAEAGISGVTINEVLEALDADGAVIGYVMTSTSHNGYGGDVPITIGIGLDGTIVGVQVLDNSETSGFGSRAKEPWFTEQFANLKADTVAAGTNFDGISGATRTTNAVTNAINAALYYASHYTAE